jgi:hypothetical protein
MGDENLTQWSSGLEMVLKNEAETSESLYWLHHRSSSVASRNNDMINIPSIILQSVTGFLSATSGLVPPLALGAISILTGIMSTILAYYKFSAKAEGHRVCAQLYLKIYKQLEVELALPITQRSEPLKLLEDVRDKLSRVSEVSPDIPDSVITEFKHKFKDSTAKRPIIANGLDEILVYRDKDRIDTPIRIAIKPPARTDGTTPPK